MTRNRYRDLPRNRFMQGNASPAGLPPVTGNAVSVLSTKARDAKTREERFAQNVGRDAVHRLLDRARERPSSIGTERCRGKTPGMPADRRYGMISVFRASNQKNYENKRAASYHRPERGIINIDKLKSGGQTPADDALGEHRRRASYHRFSGSESARASEQIAS
jgi:hypothetical protein